MINKLFKSLNYSATFFVASLFFYMNSYEAIGHCCKAIFWDGFWIDNALLYVFLFFALLVFFVNWLPSSKKRGLMLPVLFVTFLLVSLAINPKLGEYIKTVIFGVFLCCSAFIAFKYVDFKLLLKFLDIQKWLFLFLFGLSFVLLRNETYLDSANQVIAYNAATVGVVFVASTLGKQKKYSKLINAFGALLIAAFVVWLGSRGALLSYLICGAFTIVVFSRHKIASIVIICFFVFLFILNIKVVVPTIGELLTKIDPSNRLADFMNQANFFNQAGRVPIYDLFIDALNRGELLFGNGLCSDRLLIYNSLGYATYFHNIFYEVIYQFGWLFGLPLLASFLILLVIKFFSKNVSIETKAIICVLAVRGIVCLLFSGTYITTFEFFGILSIVSTINKNKHSRSINCTNGYCSHSVTVTLY